MNPYVRPLALLVLLFVLVVLVLGFCSPREVDGDAGRVVGRDSSWGCGGLC